VGLEFELVVMLAVGLGVGLVAGGSLAERSMILIVFVVTGGKGISGPRRLEAKK
jgi:hypothetical protein